jgi:hypothetical protein
MLLGLKNPLVETGANPDSSRALFVETKEAEGEPRCPSLKRYEFKCFVKILGGIHSMPSQ